MIMRRARVVALICLFPAATLRAQAAHDSLGWHFLGTLGYVQTSGNTDLSTVSLTERLSWRPNAKWLVAHDGAWVYGKTGGVESANQILADARLDYALRSNIYAYGLLTYERNTYAGISHRYAELLGLGWSAISSPRQTLSVDAGAGNTQQLTGGVSANYWVARLAPKYRYNLTDKAYAEEVLEFIENLQNTGDLRSTSTTALVAPLTRSIAIRLSYLMRYTAQPPINPATAAPFKKLDTTFQSGIQISL
jgi:putative salt-induced outer membrane protein